ncbi:hypothetical protein [Burkholderia sp. 4M9327F10]|uniref:hypothetical protein n=1 Tax=Burkholderia sp. 4M9327F10 TaxID=2502223 RepID=UPI0010F75DAA|nr:hypothetical protein [Burkholderia sp. 4M9327F10]
MNEMTNRVDLFSTALYCGGLYALWRVVLTVFFPFISGSVWQNVIGPMVIQRCPALGQSEDYSRPSYLPTAAGQPLVMSWGFLAVSIDDLTNGIRDGMLLGVWYALLPEIVQPGFLTFILAIVIGKGVWRISTAMGAAKTDCAIWAVREVLMYVGAILALQSVHFLQ